MDIGMAEKAFLVGQTKIGAKHATKKKDRKAQAITLLYVGKKKGTVGVVFTKERRMEKKLHLTAQRLKSEKFLKLGLLRRRLSRSHVVQHACTVSICGLRRIQLSGLTMQQVRVSCSS